MNEFNEYNSAFRRGLNDSRYDDDILEKDEPSVDYSNFISIGYHDGFEYGRYLVQVGMRYDIKEENIIAVIDKSFNHLYSSKIDELNNLREK